MEPFRLDLCSIQFESLDFPSKVKSNFFLSKCSIEEFTRWNGELNLEFGFLHRLASFTCYFCVDSWEWWWIYSFIYSIVVVKFHIVLGEWFYSFLCYATSKFKTFLVMVEFWNSLFSNPTLLQQGILLPCWVNFILVWKMEFVNLWKITLSSFVLCRCLLPMVVFFRILSAEQIV